MRYPATDWLDLPVDPNEEQEEQRDPDCPTTAQYDADPSKYIWIRPFGNQFRVYTYDTEAKDGYEVVIICDAPTMAEAEQARTDYIAKIKPEPIGLLAILPDIMRRFGPTQKGSLFLAILALITAGCTNLYPEKSEHREREHEFMELHMKHIGR